MKQEWLLAFENKIQTRKRFNERLFIMKLKHNLLIFGVIPLVKRQNNT